MPLKRSSSQEARIYAVLEDSDTFGPAPQADTTCCSAETACC